MKVAQRNPQFWPDRNRLTRGGISSSLDEALELIRIVQGEDVARQVPLATQC